MTRGRPRRSRRRCPQCQTWHTGNRSLCGFCEERLVGATQPEDPESTNSPRANRLRVAQRRAAQPTAGGKGQG